MQSITVTELSKAFRNVSDLMDQESEKLCEMDAFMGDGDLGLTMKKGFAAFSAAYDEQDGVEEIGKRIVKASMKMASAVPSTMGTLMSSAFMSGGMKIPNEKQVDAQGFRLFLNGMCEGIAKRGKCQRGDRTVLDTFASSCDAVNALDANESLEEILQTATKGAEEGAERTKEMVPKYGKALVHKDKALGVIDQGAYCGCLFIKALCDADNYK